MSQGGFPQAWRTIYDGVIQWFLTKFGCPYANIQDVFDPALANKVR
jgi:hypothetical protein